MSWYKNIQSEILTCTPATNATNATKRQNVANVANVARGECENSTINEADFCPLHFLLERDVGIAEVCPERGLHLVAGYSLSQDLKHLIAWWALGSFNKLLASIHEHRPITKRVIVSSLNRYRLPRGNA